MVMDTKGIMVVEVGLVEELLFTIQRMNSQAQFCLVVDLVCMRTGPLGRPISKQYLKTKPRMES